MMRTKSQWMLIMLFASIWIALVVTTYAASTHQPLWEWQGLTREPDRWWTLATLMDAYGGFITFFVWVCFKEHRWAVRGVWFIAIMMLGNIAMASYVLWQLARLPPDAPASAVLTSRAR